MSDRVEIRRDLRPGDLERIVSFHMSAYSTEYGVDASFEDFVGSAVAEAAANGWPGEREAVWIVERDGDFAGCMALTDEGETGVLRWFLLDPSIRGRGLGRRLVGELVSTARSLGFERLRLETFSELRVAAHLYLAHGFELVRESTGPRWGRDEITFQHYALELAPKAGAEKARDPVAGSA
jgi:N-acetylglutamate synthase-like GNAT family acetyltransferase